MQLPTGAFLLGLLVSINCHGQARSKGSLARGPQQEIDYDSIAQRLTLINQDDQRYRNQMNDIVDKFGGKSPEMKSLVEKMRKADSINLIQVTSIIDAYGWLGADVIGNQGNLTLFLVIQHAPLKAQEKYLPLLRSAVKSGKANAANLALLEDRVALKNGRMQIYGSQISWNMETNEYYVLPLENPDSVDRRRAKVGLGSLAQYVKECCNLIWDVEVYKKSKLNMPVKGR